MAGGTVRWLVESAAPDYQPTVSPDGRWLAYTSERSGQPEVYVQAMDGTGGRVQVPAGGGNSPRWAPDGSTLYFATGEAGPIFTPVGRPIAAARVSADGPFRVLSREHTFEGPVDLSMPGTTTWDVSPDGEEFVYISWGGGGASQASSGSSAAPRCSGRWGWSPDGDAPRLEHPRSGPSALPRPDLRR